MRPAAAVVSSVLLAAALAAATAQQPGTQPPAAPQSGTPAPAPQGPAKAEALTDQKDKTPSDFARFVKQGDGGHFDTAITTYRNAAGAEVVLFAAVHIADGACYAALEQRFAGEEALLYELVGPDEYRPRKGEHVSESFISLLQNGMKNALELSFQLDCIDYSAPNFVHADMTPDEFQTQMAERGESLFGMMMKMGLQSMRAASGDDEEGAPGAPPVDLVRAFRSGEGRHQLRLLLASALEGMEAVRSEEHTSELQSL